NLYSYVRNLPTTRYDAEGHQSANTFLGWVCVSCVANAVQAVLHPKDYSIGAGKEVGSFTYHTLMSSTPITMAIDHFKGEPRSLQPKNEAQAAGKSGTAVLLTVGSLALPMPKGTGLARGGELLLDTNAVVTHGGEVVAAGENAVKASITDVELRNIVAVGKIRGMPRAAASIPSVPNSMNINLRINVRSLLTKR